MKITLGNNPLTTFRKPRRQSVGVGTFLFLLLFGIIFTGVGTLFIKDDFISSKWPTTTSTVIDAGAHRGNDGDMLYRPTVEYTVNGVRYTKSSSFSSSARVDVGDSRTVAYEPTDPSTAVIRTSGVNLLAYLFPLLGIAVIVIAITTFVRSIKRKNAIDSLQQRGVKVTGVVTNVLYQGQDTRTCRVVVSATGPDGQIHDFVSDAVSGNTLSLIDYRNQPIPMDVYVDPSDLAKYYVDISDVPSLTPEKIGAILAKAGASFGQSNPNATPQSPPAPPVATPPVVPGAPIPPSTQPRDQL